MFRSPLPLFESLLNRGEEAIGGGAVGDPVVEGKREVAEWANGDGVKPVLSDDDRTLDHGADAENTGLRLVDDRRGKQAAGNAVIGNGKGTTLRLFGPQSFGTRPLGEIVDGAGQTEQILLVGVGNNWHQQAFIERHRNTHVDPAVMMIPCSVKLPLKTGTACRPATVAITK